MRVRVRPIDLAIPGFLALASAVEAALTATPRPAPVHAAVGIGAALALVVRRRWPLPVLVCEVAAVLVLDPQQQAALFAAVAVAAYTVGVELPALRGTAGLVLVLAPLLAGLARDGGKPADYVGIALIYAAPWGVGRVVRLHAARAETLAARADAVARGSDAQAREAVLAERARIARELHDIVAHSITVVTVQVQAVRHRLPAAQQREIDDLREVELTAREAMVEMRRLLGVLHAAGEAGALGPQPGLAELRSLAQRVADTGLEVALALDDGACAGVPAGVELAAYRIVQEALTNVRRHAQATRATVSVRRGAAALTVEVVDDGRGAGAPGVGYGLAGMRERALVCGGSFEAGRAPGGGFRVRASLPVGGELA